MLKMLSQEQLTQSSHLLYLVPFQWWSTLQLINPNLHLQNALKPTQDLNIAPHIDIIDSRQKDAFLQVVREKVNFLQIDNAHFNPKLKENSKWKAIGPKLYDLLRKKLKISLNLPLIYLDDISLLQNQFILIDQKVKFKTLKLLICSLTQNHLIYGYFDSEVSTTRLTTQLILFFQYFYSEDTKVTFLETNEFRNYKFEECNLDKNYRQELIMVHGLQRFDQNNQEQSVNKEDLEWFYPQTFQSPRAVRLQRNGEQLTMADQDSLTLSEHTMSTGAQTPFTFGLQEQDWDYMRPYQNSGLFGQKLSEQIEHMKQYALEAIYTDIIEVPERDLELITSKLNKLAEDIQQNIYRRKLHHKEVSKQGKQHYKELKDSQHYCAHLKDRDGRQSKELNQGKKEQNNKKHKQNSSVVHFSLGNQNN